MESGVLTQLLPNSWIRQRSRCNSNWQLLLAITGNTLQEVALGSNHKAIQFVNINAGEHEIASEIECRMHLRSGRTNVRKYILLKARAKLDIKLCNVETTRAGMNN